MTIATCCLLLIPLPGRQNSDQTQIYESYKIVEAHENITIPTCCLVVVLLPCRPDSENIQICEIYKIVLKMRILRLLHVSCLRFACFGLLLACFVWCAACFLLAVLLHRRGVVCTSALLCLACFWLAQLGLCCLGLACCARAAARQLFMFYKAVRGMKTFPDNSSAPRPVVAPLPLDICG